MLRVRERGPRYLILDREAIRVVATVVSATRRKRDYAGLVVLAASSAARRVIIAGIILL